MPNLDFYATAKDLVPVFRFLFDDGDLEVLESYSVPGRPIRRFDGSIQVIDALVSSPSRHLGLMLYKQSMKGRYQVERFDLKPGAVPGSARWRERVLGWGLIQLELWMPKQGRLQACHTNHNTAARALKWESTYPEMGSPESWNFKEVTRVSRRLNRHIASKLAVRKLGSRPVLQDASALFDAGELAPV